jgi:hypothetical protein
MWPDRDHLYTWIDNRSGSHFLTLTLDEPVQHIAAKLVGSFYRTDHILQPTPVESTLQKAYGQIFAPLEHLIDSSKIVFIGHKDLQSFPMELLVDSSGRFLLERFFFSYLPLESPPGKSTSDESPIVVLPARFSPASGQSELKFFENTFPDVKVHDRLGTLRPARWIHLSSHFGLNKEIWAGSGFSAGKQSLSLLDFLRTPLNCKLLSLSVCDSGNSHGWDSPYWLGVSELFLIQGARALLVNRWKLDEYSSTIFVRFFELCRNGIPMDEALALAKREFIHTTLTRGEKTASGSHPFFWAGLTYVGQPGLQLYERGSKTSIVVTSLLFGVLVLLLALGLHPSVRSAPNRGYGLQKQ